MEKPPVKDESIYFPLLYFFCHVFFLYDIQDKNDITLNHKSSFRLIARHDNKWWGLIGRFSSK